MRRKTVDTDELEVGQARESEIVANGHNGQSFREDFETVDTPRDSYALKMEAFMNEDVEIEISETDNPAAEQLIHLGVNGRNQFLWRGVPQIVKRSFVEVLARAKVANIQTPEIVDPNGNRATSIRTLRGLRYPFRVLFDPNPNGGKWLQGVMKEA